MSHRLTERDLNIPFIDKDKLVDGKLPFMLSEYTERTGSYEGKPRTESVFTMYLIEGAERGYDQLLTLSVTAPRQRVGKLLAKKSPLGPVTLVFIKKTKEGKKLANGRYEFVPVTDDATIKAADALARQLAQGSLAHPDSDDAEDDDVPF